nr:MAG TPA: hypothetical protein [Caudoviricetes sp.]
MKIQLMLFFYLFRIDKYSCRFQSLLSLKNSV